MSAVLELSSILAQFDVVDLIRIGAPRDEYDSEADRILAGLPNCLAEGDVRSLAYDVFTEMFASGVAGSEPSFTAVSAAICRWWQSRGKSLISGTPAPPLP